MKVENCIFCDNSRDFRMDPGSGSIQKKFEVTNCVFSGNFASESGWVTFISGNFANSVTASWAIHFTPTGYCPAWTTPRTVTMSPTETVSRSPDPTPTASRSSHGFSETGVLSFWPQFSGSNMFTCSGGYVANRRLFITVGAFLFFSSRFF
jgi:hypothetical protein